MKLSKLQSEIVKMRGVKAFYGGYKVYIKCGNERARVHLKELEDGTLETSSNGKVERIFKCWMVEEGYVEA
jgi:hypothetical protein